MRPSCQRLGAHSPILSNHWAIPTQSQIVKERKRPEPRVWTNILNIQAHGYGGGQPRGNSSFQESTQKYPKALGTLKSAIKPLGHTNTQPKFENKRSKHGAWANVITIQAMVEINQEATYKLRINPKIQKHKLHAIGMGHIQALYQTLKESRIEPSLVLMLEALGLPHLKAKI